MDLSPYVAQLRDDLATAAAAGDEQTRRTAALLGSAIEPAARLALMNALSDLAAEVTAALDDRTVDLRLDGRDVQVSVGGASASTPHEEPREQPRESTGWPGADRNGPLGPDAGDISRVTLRIVEQIKNQAEQAAQHQGVSLNTWVAQAVQGALSGAAGQHGFGQRGPGRPDNNRPDDDNRLRGWVQG